MVPLWQTVELLINSPRHQASLARLSAKAMEIPLMTRVTDLMGKLAITEGIEDAISVHQEAGLGAWAAGSWSFMPALSHTFPITRIVSPSLQMTMRMACAELVSWHAGSSTVGSTSS
jgi:hypothetical protein